MSTISMVSPQHASKKPCTSASCCSPSRLWRNLQVIINGDQREEFKKFVSDQTKLPHIVRVLLTGRLSNNPLVYSKPSSLIDRRLVDKFGKLSATDLNALEIALLQKHDHIAYSIVLLLKRNATPAELKAYLNHQWGKEKLTALHLASFWGMSKLVRLMLDLGADPFIQNYRQLRPIDCTTNTDIITLLQPPPPPPPTPVVAKRSSLLLKKAEISMNRSISPSSTLPDHYYFSKQSDITPVMSPLSFSSSSSSSSSSFDYHWTPPASPDLTHLVQQLDQVVVIEEQRQGCFPRHTSIMNDNKQPLVSQKQKKVHFDPQIILMDACIRGDKQEVIDVMDDSIDLNQIRDLQDRSLLHLALLYGQENIFMFLYDKIDINLADSDGWTCLHYAAALGLWRSLEFLTSLAHCNVNARTNHGLKVEDCPKSYTLRIQCKSILDRSHAT
ncbi:hypothetical protein INT47_004160, partial [Mucor saturninus]